MNLNICNDNTIDGYLNLGGNSYREFLNNFTNANPKENFDSIFLIKFLKHIKYKELPEFLNFLGSKLNQGGQLEIVDLSYEMLGHEIKRSAISYNDLATFSEHNIYCLSHIIEIAQALGFNVRYSTFVGWNFSLVLTR